MHRKARMMGNVVNPLTGTVITTIINNVVTRSGKNEQECK
jgi:hypothetical protein